jgi:hypothetical protein
VIPLNQLVPECLLALGGAFLLGNLAAYIRLRPAWRDAKQAQSGSAAKRDANGTAKGTRTSRTTGKPGRAGSAERARGRGGSGDGPPGRVRSGGAKAAAGPRDGSSGRVTARVREPTASGSKLPSRTRVLANVLIGLVITVAALATLIRG